MAEGHLELQSLGLETLITWPALVLCISTVYLHGKSRCTLLVLLKCLF